MSRRDLALVALVLATACGRPDATTTTSAAADTPTATTDVPVPATSENVAMAFFEAWQTGNRRLMEELTEPAALTEADSLSDLASDPWEFALCEGAAGTLYCSWTSEAGTLAIGVRNIEQPHLVTSVRLLDT